MTKSFTTAVRERTEEEEAEEAEGLLEFDIDGEPMEAHRPSPEQFALLMHAAGTYTSTKDAIAGFIDFIWSTMDRQYAQHLRNRLLDKDDDFGLPEIEDIVSWMVEEWTGHPMKRRSGSTSSPKSTGPRSTTRSRKSTSSASAR
jgi:hypothetical protein